MNQKDFAKARSRLGTVQLCCLTTTHWAK